MKVSKKQDPWVEVMSMAQGLARTFYPRNFDLKNDPAWSVEDLSQHILTEYLSWKDTFDNRVRFISETDQFKYWSSGDTIRFLCNDLCTSKGFGQVSGYGRRSIKSEEANTPEEIDKFSEHFFENEEIIAFMKSSTQFVSSVLTYPEKLVYLKYLEDKTQAKMAEDLGISQQRVSILLQRIFQKLKECYKGGE